MRLHRMNALQEIIDIREEATCPEALEPPRPKGGLKEYWQKKNAQSLDGLPGLAVAHESTTRFKESGPYPQDNIYISSVKEPVLDNRTAVGFLFGILVSVAFLQLRAYIAPLLSL